MPKYLLHYPSTTDCTLFESLSLLFSSTKRLLNHYLPPHKSNFCLISLGFFIPLKLMLSFAFDTEDCVKPTISWKGWKFIHQPKTLLRCLMSSSFFWQLLVTHLRLQLYTYRKLDMVGNMRPIILFHLLCFLLCLCLLVQCPFIYLTVKLTCCCATSPLGKDQKLAGVYSNNKLFLFYSFFELLIIQVQVGISYIIRWKTCKITSLLCFLVVDLAMVTRLSWESVVLLLSSNRWRTLSSRTSLTASSKRSITTHCSTSFRTHQELWLTSSVSSLTIRNVSMWKTTPCLRPL